MAKTLYVTLQVKMRTGDRTPVEAVAETVDATINDDGNIVVSMNATIDKVEIEEVGPDFP